MQCTQVDNRIDCRVSTNKNPVAKGGIYCRPRMYCKASFDRVKGIPKSKHTKIARRGQERILNPIQEANFKI
jgi:hypothetical protein